MFIETAQGKNKEIEISEIHELGMRGNGEFYIVLINRKNFQMEGVSIDYKTYRKLKMAMIYGRA